MLQVMKQLRDARPNRVSLTCADSSVMLKITFELKIPLGSITKATSYINKITNEKNKA